MMVRVGAMRHATPGLWLGRFGAWLSLVPLGLSLAELVQIHWTTCASRPGSDGSIDLAPALLFTAAAIALLLDVRAMRRGGAPAWWGRLGLTAISSAAIFGIWAGMESVFRSSGCG